MAGLEFFHERTSKGGFFFLHDFNNKDPSFDFGIQRAVDSFFKDKPEQVVELPDKWGSVIIRKVD